MGGCDSHRVIYAIREDERRSCAPVWITKQHRRGSCDKYVIPCDRVEWLFSPDARADALVKRRSLVLYGGSDVFFFDIALASAVCIGVLFGCCFMCVPWYDPIVIKKKR